MKTNRESIRLSYVNIQGLTRAKMAEVEQMLNDEHDLVLLVETHLKTDKIEISDGVSKRSSMRNLNDKKGGGLMAIYRKKSSFEVEKIETVHPDVMHMEICIRGIKFCIVLVYFSVRNSLEDKCRNDRIRKVVEKKMEELEEVPTIIIGDFNGHVTGLGKQREDKNGRMIEEWLEGYGYVMLNRSHKCEGEVTWSQRGMESTIDFALVNQRMHRLIHRMKIDEDREVCDLSDHNLMMIDVNTSGISKIIGKGSKMKTQEYFSTDEEILKTFVGRLEVRLLQESTCDMSDLNKNMRFVAEDVLLKKYKKRVNVKEKVKEKPWFNEKIRMEIKKRKSLNRKQRNSRDEMKQQHYREYMDQKKKVKRMIREEIVKYEIMMTEEIKDAKDRGRKLWKNINKLKGNEGKDHKTELYDKSGKICSESQAREDIMKYWKLIYNKHDNDIVDEWNEEEKMIYEEKREKEGITFENNELEESDFRWPLVLREHADMALKIDEVIRFMSPIDIDKKKLKNIIGKLKKRRACGPDGLKNEMYIEMSKSDVCMDILVNCLNKELERREKPNSWKMSKTVMIPKKRKPEAKDLRPIALTDCSYKILMAIVRDEIEEHLKRCGMVNDAQAGFTKNRRIEDNLFILRYCKEEAFRMKKQLVVISVDYSKAFDSVKRSSMIRVLKKYRIDSRVIELVANVYSGDKTLIGFGEGIEIDMCVTSGIRQGCSLSSMLFRLVTYEIMERIDRECRGFETKVGNLTSLFYADDGLILCESYRDAERNIGVIKDSSAACGLDINLDKTNIIVFNAREVPEEVAGVQVVDSIKYLGCMIDGNRNMFKTQKEKVMKKVKVMANMTYTVVEKSVCRMLIGKTYWKSLVLPSVLYATNVMGLNRVEIGKLQVAENSVYRKILGAPKYAPVCTLRGDVGASMMMTRVLKGMICYAKSIESRDNEILKAIYNELYKSNLGWCRDLGRVAAVADIDMRTIRTRSREALIEQIGLWDEKQWEKEKSEKRSIGLYNRFKTKIREWDVFDNSESSVTLFKMRTNTLRLKDRERFVGGSTECILCNAPLEDLQHLIFDCPSLSLARDRVLLLQRPVQEDREAVLGELLFGCVEIAERKRLTEIYELREKLVKERI